MILQDLLESHMSELDIEYQDYKNLEPVAFYSRYKMTPDEWASKHWSLIKSSETVHENDEYDDEAGMAHTNLHTTARAVQGLIDTIKSRDNLPEWVQEKIAKAEGMLVGVWDYLLSQKEQGIDPQVDEGLRDSKDNPCWKGYKPVGTKQKGGRTVPNCVPKE